MKMFNKGISLILSLVMVFGITACGSGSTSSSDSSATTSTQQSTSASESPSQTSDSEETYVWRIGTGSGGNDNNPYIWYMEQLEIMVEERSEGRIDVQLYPSGTLGTLMELSQGLIDGTVDTALIPTQYYTSIVNDALILDLSYQFESDMEAIEILNNNDTILEQHFIDNGIIPVAWIRLFPRLTVSTQEITSIEDFNGLKLWFAPSSAIQNKASSLGVVSCNFDLGELASSLQNGTVDGAWTDISLIAAQGLYESAPHILTQPADVLLSTLAVSQIWYNKLPSDLQQLVIDCSLELAELEYERVNEVESVYNNIITSGGGTFYDASDSLADSIKEALTEETSWLLENYPDITDSYNELQALITEYRT